MYSLNEVAEWKISPEKLYIAPATFTFYQKNCRTEQTCQQQCVLSRCMFSDTIVECFRMRHKCMIKIASDMT